LKWKGGIIIGREKRERESYMGRKEEKGEWKREERET
jgi:hypothetical protein